MSTQRRRNSQVEGQAFVSWDSARPLRVDERARIELMASIEGPIVMRRYVTTQVPWLRDSSFRSI